MKVKNKMEVIEWSKEWGHNNTFRVVDGRMSFARSAELEAKHQKYKGRVVLRGDIVKDDSGSYAVFTGQGSSASQMTAAKVMDIISRLPGCSGQAADAVSVFSQVKNGRCTITVQKFRSQNVQKFGYVYQIRNGQHHGPIWKIQSFLLNEICTVILWQDYYGNGNLRKSYWNMAGRRFPIGNVSLYIEKKDLFLSVYVDEKKKNWLERNRILTQRGKYSWKTLIWENPTSFLDHVYLGCTQRECQISRNIADNYRKYVWIQDFCWSNGKTTSFLDIACTYFFMVLWHGRSCKKVRGNVLRTGKQNDATIFSKSQHHALTTTHSKKKKWDLLENSLKFARRLFWNVYSWHVIGRAWYFVVCEQTCSCSYKMDSSLWQTPESLDIVHPSHMWRQTILPCGKHRTTMQIRIVSRLWFCRRPWRLRINIRGILMHFRKSNISLTQLNGSWSFFLLMQVYAWMEFPRFIFVI